MKTHIIQIEPHDDLISLKDKLAWSKSSRVLMVWPIKKDYIPDKLDITLLKRQADDLGNKIAFVTRNQELVDTAKDVGIAVFPKIGEANKKPWKSYSKKKFVKKNQQPFEESLEEFKNLKIEQKTQPIIIRWSLFLIGILSVLSIVFIFAPKTEIELDIIEVVEKISLVVDISPENEAISLSGSIPGYVESVVVEGKKTGLSTGMMVFPDHFASGYVEFENQTNAIVIIPEGTIISSTVNNGIKYLTQEEISLQVDHQGEVSCPVIAITPGSDGNLDSYQMDIVEGVLGTQVLVRNATPIFGGTDKYYSSPTELDFSIAEEELLSSLKPTALEEILKRDGEDRFYLADTLLLDEVIEKNRFPTIKQPSDLIEVSTQAVYTIWFYEKSELEKLVQDTFTAQIDPEFEPVDQGFDYKLIGSPEIVNDHIEIEIEASRVIRKEIDKNHLFKILRGRKITDIRTILDNQLLLNTAYNVVVEQKPNWWPYFSFLIFRYNIEVR
ncbi:MAG: baseplate J/gp47 family protein [Anaerolineaceae bacterium]|nr:baseplate J/gp47 family protein [Anaerolineaceae bacterium]